MEILILQKSTGQILRINSERAADYADPDFRVLDCQLDFSKSHRENKIELYHVYDKERDRIVVVNNLEDWIGDRFRVLNENEWEEITIEKVNPDGSIQTINRKVLKEKADQINGPQIPISELFEGIMLDKLLEFEINYVDQFLQLDQDTLISCLPHYDKKVHQIKLKKALDLLNPAEPEAAPSCDDVHEILEKEHEEDEFMEGNEYLQRAVNPKSYQKLLALGIQTISDAMAADDKVLLKAPWITKKNIKETRLKIQSIYHDFCHRND